MPGRAYVFTQKRHRTGLTEKRVCCRRRDAMHGVFLHGVCDPEDGDATHGVSTISDIRHPVPG